MEFKKVDFKDTGYFSEIVLDYLTDDPKLHDFFQYPPELAAFGNAIKNRNFPDKNRDILADRLTEQYSKSKINEKDAKEVFRNIGLLRRNNTYTVTTGHQLCLFTGPMYFIYKIVNIINLSKKLSEVYPDCNFVPVYWMATEDHDFDEIDHFNFKNALIQWKSNQSGAVGRMSTEGLYDIYNEFSALLGEYNTRAEKLKKLFSDAYLKHSRHSEAFRYLVNELFSAQGLVIVDGDDPKLKELFAPVVKEDLLNNASFELVEATNKKLSEHYKIQVNPREINLFYLQDGLRERILKENNKYLINNTELQFTEEEILELLKNEPESFSPNVLLRPIYQETILPNLAYVGGGGELAYWFQLRSSFDHFNLPMPLLFLRNSVKLIIGKSAIAIEELDLKMEQLFLKEDVLAKLDTLTNSSMDLSLKTEKQLMEKLYVDLVKKAETIDASLKSFVEANLQNSINKINKTSSKFIRAEKRRNSERIEKIKKLKADLFPHGSLQERVCNFSTFYLLLGDEMMQLLFEQLDLEDKQFLLMVENGH